MYVNVCWMFFWSNKRNISLENGLQGRCVMYTHNKNEILVIIPCTQHFVIDARFSISSILQYFRCTQIDTNVFNSTCVIRLAMGKYEWISLLSRTCKANSVCLPPIRVYGKRPYESVVECYVRSLKTSETKVKQYENDICHTSNR